MKRTVLLWLTTVLAVGCVDNSILELEIDLPPQPAEVSEQVYAFVQIRSSRMSSFATDWLSAGEDPDGFALGPERATQTISVVAEPRDYDEDLLLRVVYCVSPRCSSLGDDTAGERRLVIEHPFYDGQRTRVRWSVGDYTPVVIPEEETVGVCQVEGCRAGDGLADYCYVRTQDHFCSR
ncbi:MAG: hypothetical protein AB8H86_19690 [Polyangiales bacterium]